jgi:nicotinate-nucleotide adenylyltransferase
MRIGIFGGTFDPPHLGHLILADEAMSQLALERLLWVLTPEPPHKQGQVVSPLGVRLEMLHAALQDDPRFEISRVEMDRPGPHYAADTVGLLAGQLPKARLVYLIGGDSLHDLPSWHEPGRFLEGIYRLGVMRRPGDSIDLARLEDKLPGIGGKIRFIEAPLLEISSSQIRERVAAGRGYRYYLPPRVYQVVKRENLYRVAEVKK